MAVYDLLERTFLFARNNRDFCRELDNDIINREYIKQLVRSSGSVGANFIEADEALSKKDFQHRIKIYRKEAKESRYWLRLLLIPVNKHQSHETRYGLIIKVFELIKSFSTILKNSNN